MKSVISQQSSLCETQGSLFFSIPHFKHAELLAVTIIRGPENRGKPLIIREKTDF
jgi:hypothetical protein